MKLLLSHASYYLSHLGEVFVVSGVGLVFFSLGLITHEFIK
jgi:hypothetical protein